MKPSVRLSMELGSVAFAVFTALHAPVTIAQDTSSSAQPAVLQEIVVTAQKRSENLMDVPSSIAVVSNDRLQATQINSLADLATYVPGLTVESGGGPGQRNIVMRGLSTGYSNNTTAALVATYIDDVPVGSSSSAGRGAQFGLDLMPYDVKQVEVLRGPQGTLYGADAMGGLIKYELVEPSLNSFSGIVGTTLEDIAGSDRPSWIGRGAFDLPIVHDSLGLRLSGFYDHADGYIDNVGTNIKNANVDHESGGRATALWRPASSLTVQATLLAQDVNQADETAVTVNEVTGKPLYGPQAYSTVFPQPYAQQLRLSALTVHWDLGFATASSSSSWQRVDGNTGQDLSADFGPLVPGYPNALVPFGLWDDVSKFTQEIRLTSPEDQQLQWLVGAYYTDEDGSETENVPAISASRQPLPPPSNLLLYGTTRTVFQETAGFADLTYRIADRFEIGGGARYSHNSQTFRGSSIGLFGSGAASGSSAGGVTTWMANGRFHPTDNQMIYTRVATGYRPGGANRTFPGVPAAYDADTLTNYEVGYKATLLDQRLRFDADEFYIDWNHIQMQIPNSVGLIYTGNGGNATSQGQEMTIAYIVVTGLRLGFTVNHTDAHLAQDAPSIDGKAGDQLPDSPRWASALTADFERPIAADMSLITGIAYRYRDGVDSQFASSPAPEPIGPQNITDAYVGSTIGALTARLYVKNLLANHSYTGLLYLTDPARPNFVPVQPRTIGLSLDYAF